MLVLVAADGKSYEIVEASRFTINEVKAHLAASTGVAAEDQILVFEGRHLDGAVLDSPPDKVFMYSKKALQQDAPLPSPEPCPVVNVDIPAMSQVSLQPHDALQDELGELPRYEQEFRHRSARAKAHLAACTGFVRACERLLSEQEVQAQAIDSAQENVDKHYAYICEMYDGFKARFDEHTSEHGGLLERFPSTMAALTSQAVHPALQAAGFGCLADLLPKDRLMPWHAQCVAMDAQFRPKAAEMARLFGSIKRDVESLFMTAPSVDLTKLSERLQGNHGVLSEVEAIASACAADEAWAKAAMTQAANALTRGERADAAVDAAAAALRAALVDPAMMGGGGGGPPRSFVRLEECAKVLERFAKHCVDCKNAMSRCVVSPPTFPYPKHANLAHACTHARETESPDHPTSQAALPTLPDVFFPAAPVFPFGLCAMNASCPLAHADAFDRGASEPDQNGQGPPVRVQGSSAEPAQGVRAPPIGRRGPEGLRALPGGGGAEARALRARRSARAALCGGHGGRLRAGGGAKADL